MEGQSFHRYILRVPNVYTSSRLEKAKRLNMIEEARLKSRASLIERQKDHSFHISNRGIKETMGYMRQVKASSGISPDGLPPNFHESQQTRSFGIFFMYGKRMYSRRFGKYRSKSAVDSYASTRQLFLGEAEAMDQTKNMKNPFWRLYQGAGSSRPVSAVERVRRVGARSRSASIYDHLFGKDESEGEFEEDWEEDEEDEEEEEVEEAKVDQEGEGPVYVDAFRPARVKLAPSEAGERRERKIETDGQLLLRRRMLPRMTLTGADFRKAATAVISGPSAAANRGRGRLG